MLDLKSAEVVTIDFGYSFEIGRLLLTPETVPFRLTREIISAMGVTGYNGQFRHSAETTLKVMKDNQSLIMALLEVLIHDPLYMWELTEDKLKRYERDEVLNEDIELTQPYQTGNFEGRNARAESALARVLTKLNCRVDDSMVEVSVKGVVSTLVQQATCEHRLSKMFHDWGAYF